MSEKLNTLKQLVLEKRDEGKVVYLSHNGREYDMVSTPVEHFIQQPADGILYDLNRLEEVVLTFMGDPEASYKWINDFAVALTIRALKDAIVQAQADVEALRRVDETAEALILSIGYPKDRLLVARYTSAKAALSEHPKGANR